MLTTHRDREPAHNYRTQQQTDHKLASRYKRSTIIQSGLRTEYNVRRMLHRASRLFGHCRPSFRALRRRLLMSPADMWAGGTALFAEPVGLDGRQEPETVCSPLGEGLFGENIKIWDLHARRRDHAGTHSCRNLESPATRSDHASTPRHATPVFFKEEPEPRRLRLLTFLSTLSEAIRSKLH